MTERMDLDVPQWEAAVTPRRTSLRLRAKQGTPQAEFLNGRKDMIGSACFTLEEQENWNSRKTESPAVARRAAALDAADGVARAPAQSSPLKRKRHAVEYAGSPLAAELAALADSPAKRRALSPSPPPPPHTHTDAQTQPTTAAEAVATAEERPRAVAVAEAAGGTEAGGLHPLEFLSASVARPAGSFVSSQLRHGVRSLLKAASADRLKERAARAARAAQAQAVSAPATTNATTTVATTASSSSSSSSNSHSNSSSSGGGGARAQIGASLLAMLLVHRADAPVLALVAAASPSEQLEELAGELLAFYAAHGQEARLLSWAVEAEVAATTDFSTLFRGVSLATKLMSAFLQRQEAGQPLLPRLLDAAVAEVRSAPEGAYEVDADRISSAGEAAAEENVVRLAALAQALLSAVETALADRAVPRATQQLLASVRQAVASRWGEERARAAVGGLFFLRFLCPALMARGTGAGQRSVTRPLVLLSKVLQNLSNHVSFGEKEAYMVRLNGFLATAFPLMERLLDGLATPIAAADTPRPPTRDAAYYCAAAALAARVVRHQHSLLAGLDPVGQEELREALEVFSAGKAQAAIRNVASDLRRLAEPNAAAQATRSRRGRRKSLSSSASSAVRKEPVAALTAAAAAATIGSPRRSSRRRFSVGASTGATLSPRR